MKVKKGRAGACVLAPEVCEPQSQTSDRTVRVVAQTRDRLRHAADEAHLRNDCSVGDRKRREKPRFFVGCATEPLEALYGVEQVGRAVQRQQSASPVLTVL